MALMMRTTSRVLKIAATAALPLALAGAASAGAAVPTGNLVVNGGAEIGPGAGIIDNDTPDPRGWTADNAGFRAVKYEEPGAANGILHTDEARPRSGVALNFGA